ncbi:MAG: hypothetical protein E3J72_06620 [Planctomycetota bacterium]|nr:MAG: hypothetical protein E3J72_06620 [Planctomycetota bacterium]
MPKSRYIKLDTINLKSHPEFNEKWVQDRIAEDPSILGLGELILKDKERLQPSAGRLDFLMQEPESNRRYEVEIQLGKTNESHIIRTIEYWDIERKRFPQYDHCAVIVAEDITSRFLNVISLFNGMIPIIAIQMSALKFEDNIALSFTTVLDELTLGFDEDEQVEPTDRSYWEKRGTKQTIALADKMLDMVHTFAPELEFKYNKFHIGLAQKGKPNNFVVFYPKKSFFRAEIRIKPSSDIQKMLDNAGLEFDYYKPDRRYRIRLNKDDIAGNVELLTKLLKISYEN